MLLVVSAAASPPTERSHAERSFAARPGGTVDLQLAFHHAVVDVRPGDTVDVTVDIEIAAAPATARKLVEDYEPRFEETGDRIVVRSQRASSGVQVGSVRLRGQVTVAMPPGMNLRVETSSGDCTVKGDLGDAGARFDTSSGGVHFAGAVRELTANVSSGDVVLSLRRIAHLVKVESSSGCVEMAGLAAVVQVNTSSGDVTLRDLVGHALIDTSSGSVDAQWAKQPRGIKARIDTNSGTVSLAFPEGSDLAGAVSTTSGTIRSDFPGRLSTDRDHLRLEGRAGGVSLHVDTSSGGVHLRRV